MDEIETKIRDIIAREAKLDPAIIQPDSTIKDLGIESIDLVQIMFQIEESFDIYLAEEEVGLDVQNVGQVIDAVRRLVAEKAATAAPPQAPG